VSKYSSRIGEDGGSDTTGFSPIVMDEMRTFAKTSDFGFFSISLKTQCLRWPKGGDVYLLQIKKIRFIDNGEIEIQ
jgi:hypothetical protein